MTGVQMERPGPWEGVGPSSPLPPPPKPCLSPGAAHAGPFWEKGPSGLPVCTGPSATVAEYRAFWCFFGEYTLLPGTLVHCLL